MNKLSNIYAKYNENSYYGRRLWPLSSESCPKQFIQTLNGLSSFQLTLLRHATLGMPTIIINEKHIDIATKQIAAVALQAQFIIEPESKNTATCAILASLIAASEGCDGVVLLPADLHIVDEDHYLETLRNGFLHMKHSVVTIGIKPTTPHTGYGYIKANKFADQALYNVEQFVEKPNLIQATSYLTQGGYFWNSGIFIYDAKYLLEQVQRLHESLYRTTQEALATAAYTALSIQLNKESYAKIESISVDHAIMKHMTGMKLLEGEFGWSDIGSWDTLWKMQTKNAPSNYLEGDVLTHNVTNSYIVSSKKPLVVMGLDNIAVIDTDDAIFVSSKSSVEDMRFAIRHMQHIK